MRAAMLGVEMDEIEVSIDSESNDYGILGIDDSTPAGPLSVRSDNPFRPASTQGHKTSFWS